MSKGLSANLDFLRAVAVLLVLGQHLTRRLNGDLTTGMPTSYLGLFGVLLFFVHTSLVLMYSMERSGLEGKSLLKDFYIRRIFRIYPLSILAICAALALHLDSNINGIAGLSPGPLPSNKAIFAQLVLMQNVVHVKSIVNVLWSLPYEIQMYVFLPFLFAWVRRGQAFVPLMMLWVASLVGAWVQPHLSLLGPAMLLLFVPCFLPGIMAFALLHRPVLPSSLWLVFLFGLIAAFTLKPVLATGWFLCLLLGVSIPFFRELQSNSIRIVANRIATYSYGIYVSHQFCIWFAMEKLATQPMWLRTAVLIASLIAVPVVLYHALEKPMIGIGVRLARRSREKRVVALPAAA